MLYFDRTDVSGGIDVDKTSASKEWIICYHFLDQRIKFQEDICNWCHDVSMMSVNLSNIAILNTHGVDFCRIVSRIRKSGSMDLLNNANLNEKSGTLWDIKICYHV